MTDEEIYTREHNAREAKESIGSVISEIRSYPPERELSLAITKLEEATHWLRAYAEKGNEND